MQQSCADVGDSEACDEVASGPEPVARVRYGCQRAGLVGQGRGANVLIHEGGASSATPALVQNVALVGRTSNCPRASAGE